MSRINPQYPGEIYEDKHGHRWLVVSLCNEPTVTMQKIEAIPRASGLNQQLGHIPTVQGGGVSGLMWDGFTKVADAPLSSQAQ